MQVGQSEVISPSDIMLCKITNLEAFDLWADFMVRSHGIDSGAAQRSE